jgi:hypothetical protein
MKIFENVVETLKKQSIFPDDLIDIESLKLAEASAMLSVNMSAESKVPMPVKSFNKIQISSKLQLNPHP